MKSVLEIDVSIKAVRLNPIKLASDERYWIVSHELYNWYLCCKDGVDMGFKQGSIFEELLIFCG
jgi:hypothetical protein